MKINKRLLPIFAIVLIFLAAFIAGSFSHRDQSDAREVIRSELDRLKDLDSKTTQKYISYKEMFPDATENTELSDEINNVFSLFFQKFDYKILDISVDKKSKTAEASLKLTTIDAQSLGQRFCHRTAEDTDHRDSPGQIRNCKRFFQIPGGTLPHSESSAYH